ncbi:MAG: hypothetical protein Kow0089_07930 [Desulfobulbaceae bacterium]
MKRVHAIILSVFIFVSFSSTAGHAEELIFSTHPFSNPTAIHKRFEPLVTYLSRETGMKISINVAPTYHAHITALGTGKADLGFAGPSPYVRIKDKYGGIELLARFRMKNDINDKVVILCRRDAPLTTLSDLRGKTFAFGDHQSFGSHFMPRWLLNQEGISLNDLTGYDFVKSHDNVILSVLHSDFDGGGVRQDVYEKYKNRPLRILAGPFAIPPHVLVIRTNVNVIAKEKIRNAVLSLHDREILDRIDKKLLGFEPVDDEDFDQARTVIRYIESR